MERGGEIDMILILILTAIILIIAISKWTRNLGDEVATPENDSHAYRDASAAYLLAQQNFLQADPQYIDVAIGDLFSTEIRVNNELWKIRHEAIGSNPDTWKWISLACDGDLQHHNRTMATLEIAVAGYERW